MKKNILLSKLFLGALVLLILNDWVLKGQFHNAFTGKLSDFAGLCAFALFWTAFFPSYKRHIFISTAFLFLFWKSPWSQPLIDGWNQLTFFKVARVVDYSDYIALIILPVAYRYNKIPVRITTSRFAVSLVSIVALLSFTATSYVTEYKFNKTYTFNFSKEELIKRLNTIQNKCSRQPLSLNISRADTFVTSVSDTAYYSLAGYKIYIDTLYKYDSFRHKLTNKIDSVWRYKIPQYDTLFIPAHGKFRMPIPFESCYCEDATIKITGNSEKCSLGFISVSAVNCGQKNNEENLKLLQNNFELDIIKKVLGNSQ